jgi:hypothetical protein
VLTKKTVNTCWHLVLSNVKDFALRIYKPSRK